jgi:hypothetical protein
MYNDKLELAGRHGEDYDLRPMGRVYVLRRRAMAEESTSRNPLVVGRSIFVLLTIGFTVTANYGFAEQVRLRVKDKNYIARMKRANEAKKES